MSKVELLTISIAIISATLLAIEVFYIYRTFRNDHIRTRKQATLEFLDSITQQYTPLRESLEAKYGSDDLSTLIINFEDLQKDDIAKLRQWLNRLEHLAVGVHQEVFDLEVVSHTMGSSLTKRLDELKPYIEQRRQLQSTAYLEFEFMVNNIKRIRQFNKPLKFNAEKEYSLAN